MRMHGDGGCCPPCHKPGCCAPLRDPGVYDIAPFSSDTPGMRASRLVLHVANDNQLCHRGDFPTDEELTAWVRELIRDGDHDVREFLPVDAIDVRWSEPARDTCHDCAETVGECACECPTCGETLSACECEGVES